jgi:single-strand DNA-binding protein
MPNGSVPDEGRTPQRKETTIMFETPMTIVGQIVTEPRRRVVAGQELISFRVASNSRRRTGEGTWEPGNSLFVTVNCWGRLVTGVGAGLYKGAPVIAVGTVHTSEYEDRDGAKRSSLEMRATAVGPDLARVIARIAQPGQPQGNQPVEGQSPQGQSESVDGQAGGGDVRSEAEVVADADSEGLALGAPA